MKVKRLLSQLLFVFGIGSTFSAHGIVVPPPPPGSFKITGEWIYFKPQVDHNFFVNDLSSVPPFYQGRRDLNQLRHHSGFRIEGDYAFCGCAGDLSLCWTHFNSSDTKSLNGTFQLAEVVSLPVTGFFDNRVDILVNSVELLYNHSLYCGCDFSWWIAGGVQYAHLKVQDRSRDFSGATFNIYSNNSKIDSIGPELAFFGSYTLPCWDRFSVVLSASTALLVARTRHEAFLQNQTLVLISLNDERFWRVVPFFDIKGGLNFQFCVCSFPINLQVGYEVMDYFRSFYRLDFRATAGGFLFSEKYSDLSFHGPYVQLGFAF